MCAAETSPTPKLLSFNITIPKDCCRFITCRVKPNPAVGSLLNWSVLRLLMGGAFSVELCTRTKHINKYIKWEINVRISIPHSPLPFHPSRFIPLSSLQNIAFLLNFAQCTWYSREIVILTSSLLASLLKRMCPRESREVTSSLEEAHPLWTCEGQNFELCDTKEAT